jgi:hypothetical protein
MEPPNTGEEKFKNEYKKILKKAETRNLRKPDFSSKVVNPFTRALGSPFIGR